MKKTSFIVCVLAATLGFSSCASKKDLEELSHSKQPIDERLSECKGDDCC